LTYDVSNWWYSVVVSISGCGPLDPGSNPGTAILFGLSSLVFSIRGRAVKALRSGRSQLCWRGFDSHRMHFFTLHCILNVPS
jgi:hypothetical protein